MINKNLPDTKYLILELENSWLTIWFNRPEKKNALSDDLINEVKLTLLSIEQDFTIEPKISKTPRESELENVFGKYSGEIPADIVRYMRKNPKIVINRLERLF